MRQQLAHHLAYANLAVLLCRHAGPLATLPSVLLMQGTIKLGLGTVLGTQGALFFHQK